jgi:integrase
MRLMTHLRKLNDGTYEVRIVVPADCREKIGKSNLTRRIGRISKVEANRLAIPIVAEFNEQIAGARQAAVIGRDVTEMIDPARAMLAIARWSRREIERQRTLIFNGLDPEGPPDLNQETDAWLAWRRNRNMRRATFQVGKISDRYDEQIANLLAQEGIHVAVNHPVIRSLRRKFASAMVGVMDAADEVRSHSAIAIEITGLSEDVRSVFEPGERTAAATHRPGGAKIVSLHDLFDGYVAERKPAASTVKRWRPIMDSLVGHVGHDDASQFSFEHIISWKTELLSSKAPKTVREVYLAALKTVLTWAVENRKLPANVASGTKVRAAKHVIATRPKGFTKAEALIILRAALDADKGRLSVEHRRARRWMPWLLAYSGARVGEVGQLRGQDVVKIEGVWAIRITPDAGSVKTGKARIVPVHPHLIEMGFVEVARELGARPIFYDPARGRDGSKANPHAKKVGERLAAWVRALGVNDPKLQPTHGWRHHFKTRCRLAGVSQAAMDALQGHAPRTEGESYGDWPISVLADAINKLPRFEV